MTKVQSPRMAYIGMPGATLLAQTVTGLRASIKQELRIGDDATELKHDCGTADDDSWKGESAVFGDVVLRADANGWTATLAAFPEVVVRLTESNAARRKNVRSRCWARF